MLGGHSSWGNALDVSQRSDSMPTQPEYCAKRTDAELGEK